MQHLPRLASFLLPLSLLTVAACNEVETGELGVVEFVPDDCGDTFCDLDDGLAVDATTEVYLNAVDGGSTYGLDIRTSDPSIAEVIDDTFAGRVTIIGNRPGLVDLLAIDANGYVVDYHTIRVAAPASIDIEVDGMAQTGRDTFELEGGGLVSIRARALAGDGDPLMGRMDYDVAIDAELFAALRDGEDLQDGELQVNPPAGEHFVSFALGAAEATAFLSVR